MSLKKRDKHLLYELSTNAREKQTNIAKRLRISPQTLKYHLDNLTQKRTYNTHTIIDPARRGLITIRCFLNFTSFNKHTQNDIIRELKDKPDVVFIQRLRLGADLLIEYAVPNLSYFNKTHTAFLHQNSDAIRNTNTYPVLVRYIFSRTYMRPRTKNRSKILSGDREPVDISTTEQEVLNEIIKEPQSTILDLARKTSHDPRTIRSAITHCEKNKIIRGYSIDIDYRQTKISSALLGIHFNYVTPKELDRFVEFANQTKEIVRLEKVIGQEEVFLSIETFTNYTEIIEHLREEFKITQYSVFEAGNIEKNTYVPRY